METRQPDALGAVGEEVVGTINHLAPDFPWRYNFKCHIVLACAGMTRRDTQVAEGAGLLNL